MSKFHKLYSKFSKGKISDRLKSRADIQEFSEFCDVVENFIIQKQGGAVKRPGTQFVNQASNGTDFTGQKLLPFIFSQNEAYVVIVNNTESIGFQIYKTDGTQARIDITGLANTTLNLDTYDPNNWNYAQNGDTLVLTYAAPTTDPVAENPGQGVNAQKQIAPVFITRVGDLDFKAFTFTHPNFLDNVPNLGKYSPAVNRPYLPPNVDPDLKLFSIGTAVGTGNELVCLDRNSQPVSFFEYGHSFADDGSAPTRIGAFFKLQSGNDEGVAWIDGWLADESIPSSPNINVGLNTLTLTSGSSVYITGDTIVLSPGGLGTTPPTIDGYPLVNGNFGQFFVRGAHPTFTLHPTQEDAINNTNVINISAAGDDGLLWQAQKVSRVSNVVIEVEIPAAVQASGTDNWQESAWSAARGFPRATVFHEQRLVFGGTEKNPDTVWFSQVGNIYNFMARRLEQDTSTPTIPANTNSTFGFVLSGDVTVTDPVDATIASKQANIIQWLESQNVLLIGTLGAEYTVSGGDFIISNESLFVGKQTDYGSNIVQATSIGNSVIFCSRDGRRLRSFRFNRQNGSYVSTDLNALSDNIVFAGFDGAASSTLKDVEFKEITYQPSRDVMWCLTTNNQLLGLTFNRELDSLAWHHHPIRSTDTVLSIIVLPSDNGDYDELWLLVGRGGLTDDDIYLEKMGDDFEHDVLNNTSTSNSDVPYYSDSAVKVSLGSSTNTVTLPVNAGLPTPTQSHLEGETVTILAGDTVQTTQTVTGGQVTLDQVYPAGTVVVIGLPYTSILQTVALSAGGDFGTSVGNRMRVDRLDTRFFKSQGGAYGNQNQSTLFNIEYDNNDVFTGIKRLDFEATPNMDIQIKFSHDTPVPFNILGFSARGVAYD